MSMPQPKHGILLPSSGNIWEFFPGKSGNINIIPLPDLMANCRELLDTGQLFRGHTKFKNVYDAWNQVILHDSVLHQISAHGLKSLLPPASPKQHQRMDPEDKSI
jgi:hypothetical protein